MSNNTDQQAGEPTPRTAVFLHAGQRVELELMDGCSVSSHLETTSTFHEQDYLERVGAALPSGCVIIDAGAHLGNHTVFFAQIRGFRVIAFEPNPAAFARLTQNVAIARVEHLVTCHRVALSGKKGDATMYAPIGGDQGMASLEDHNAHLAGGHFSVSTARLDDLTADLDADAVFLKVDVEGHELAVLAGASNLLENGAISALSVECRTVDAFARARDMLGEGYQPIRVTNPTSRVIFANTQTDSISFELEDSAEATTIESGIRASAEAKRALANTKDFATRLAGANRSLDGRTTQLEVVRAERDAAVESALEGSLILDAVATASGVEGAPPAVAVSRAAVLLRKEPPRCADLGRLALVNLRSGGPSAALLSALIERVDEFEIRPDGRGCAITHRTYERAKLTYQRTVHHSARDASLITVDLLRLAEIRAARTSHAPCLVYAPESDPVLAETITGALGAPYLLAFDEPSYNGTILRLENGAEACFVPNDAARREWGLKHVVEASILSPSDLSSLVDALDDVAHQIRQRSCVGTESTVENALRLLIVSYFADPSTPVSTQRLGYWHANLTGLAARRSVELDVCWLSATARATDRANHLVIRDRGDRIASTQLRSQLAEMQALGIDTIGASWAENVRRELPSRVEPFDVVLISCGPFGYLGLAAFFRELWDCQVVVDFRDPYAGDPRMGFTLERREWLFAHERECLGSVDAIVSVNQQCLRTIAPSLEVDRHAISNGFDETVIDPVRMESGKHDRTDALISFVYCGTIYPNWGMDKLLDAMSPARHRLRHLGRDQSRTKLVERHVVGDSLGFVGDKTEMARVLCNADAGIVRIGGETTVATTKVFDYIGCDLDVIIVTDGQPHSGALHELTEDLLGVYWVRNDEDDLRAFFDAYEPLRRVRSQRELFSRRHQATLLLDLLFPPGSPEWSKPE